MSNSFTASSISCGITISHENVANNAIQLALNAVAKSKISPITICVGPGIYPEQLNITSRGGISLVGLGNADNPTVIQPISAIVNNIDAFFGNDPQIAIILAGSNGTSSTFQGINIRNLVINGAKASQSLNNYPICYSDYAGVMYNGASGMILNNTFENIYAPVSQAGCGTGGGINVDKNNNLSPNETVTIANNIVRNYGTFGIACFGEGIICNISQNMISPYVKYASLVELFSGIAIFGGTQVTATQNTIRNNVCTDQAPPFPCGPSVVTNDQGFGIVTSGASDGSILRDNTLTNNNIGIFVGGDATSVLNNKISDSTFIGIAADGGSGTYQVVGNSLSQSPVGIEAINEGYITGDDTFFTTNLVSNSLAHVPISVEIITFSPGEVVVHYLGKTFTVSGNSTVII